MTDSGEHYTFGVATKLPSPTVVETSEVEGEDLVVYHTECTRQADGTWKEGERREVRRVPLKKLKA